MNITDSNGVSLTPEMIEAGWNFHYWLAVLCSPAILRSMRRTPIPEHIVRVLDAYLPYASGKQSPFSTVGVHADPQQREMLMRKLRGIIARWRPPEIPEELVETARALMRAEGVEVPLEGFTWDPKVAPEDCLLWPEGVPLIVQGKW